MKKVLTLVMTMLVGASLAFAVPQTGGGSTDSKTNTAHKGGKTAKTSKAHKGGKKSKKNSGTSTTTTNPK